MRKQIFKGRLESALGFDLTCRSKLIHADTGVDHVRHRALAARIVFGVSQHYPGIFRVLSDGDAFAENERRVVLRVLIIQRDLVIITVRLDFDRALKVRRVAVLRRLALKHKQRLFGGNEILKINDHLCLCGFVAVVFLERNGDLQSVLSLLRNQLVAVQGGIGFIIVLNGIGGVCNTAGCGNIEGAADIHTLRQLSLFIAEVPALRLVDLDLEFNHEVIKEFGGVLNLNGKNTRARCSQLAVLAHRRGVLNGLSVQRSLLGDGEGNAVVAHDIIEILGAVVRQPLRIGH